MVWYIHTADSNVLGINKLGLEHLEQGTWSLMVYYGTGSQKRYDGAYPDTPLYLCLAPSYLCNFSESTLPCTILFFVKIYLYKKKVQLYTQHICSWPQGWQPFVSPELSNLGNVVQLNLTDPPYGGSRLTALHSPLLVNTWICKLHNAIADPQAPVHSLFPLSTSNEIKLSGHPLRHLVL